MAKICGCCGFSFLTYPRHICYHIWLVVLTILKNMKVNGVGIIPPYMMENRTCLKPPTRYIIYIYYNSQITTEKIGMVPSIFTLPFPRYISGWWLSPTSLKNMRKSVGMMTFPIYGKITCSKLPTRHIVPLISHVKPSSTQHSPRIKVRDSPQLFGASCSHISAVPAVPAPVQEGSKMEWPHCHPAPNLEPRAEIRGRTN